MAPNGIYCHPNGICQERVMRQKSGEGFGCRRPQSRVAVIWCLGESFCSVTMRQWAEAAGGDGEFPNCEKLEHFTSSVTRSVHECLSRNIGCPMTPRDSAWYDQLRVPLHGGKSVSSAAKHLDRCRVQKLFAGCCTLSDR